MADETKPKSETTSDGDGKNTAGSGEGDGNPSTNGDAKTFTQADVDDIITKRLKAEREKTKREAEEAEKLRQEAADKEAGKHKELATRFESERDAAKVEATTLKETYEALSSKVSVMVQADIDALPEDIRNLAPTSLEDRLEWLPKAKQSAAKLAASPAVPGNSKNPKPVGGKDADTVKQENKHSLRQRGGYGW